MNKVVEILMRRDGLTEKEATKLVDDTREDLLDAVYNGNVLDAEDVIMDNLGLEPDYLFDIIDII